MSADAIKIKVTLQLNNNDKLFNEFKQTNLQSRPIIHHN